jgi:hypothetical protein
VNATIISKCEMLLNGYLRFWPTYRDYTKLGISEISSCSLRELNRGPLEPTRIARKGSPIPGRGPLDKKVSWFMMMLCHCRFSFRRVVLFTYRTTHQQSNQINKPIYQTLYHDTSTLEYHLRRHHILFKRENNGTTAVKKLLWQWSIFQITAFR